MSWIEAWIVSWEVWVIAGLALAILDVLVGASGHIIALGCACFMMSALAALSPQMEVDLIPNWKVAAVEFAVFAGAAVFVVRLLRQPGSEDVNRY